jgi:hypothetical protein
MHMLTCENIMVGPKGLMQDLSREPMSSLGGPRQVSVGPKEGTTQSCTCVGTKGVIEQG